MNTPSAPAVLPASESAALIRLYLGFVMKTTKVAHFPTLFRPRFCEELVADTMLTPLFTREGPPDHVLVTQLKNGDEEAFKALIIKHQNFSNTHSYQLTGNRRRALILSSISLEHLWHSRAAIPDFYMTTSAPPFWLYLAKIIHAYFDVLRDEDYNA